MIASIEATRCPQQPGCGRRVDYGCLFNTGSGSCGPLFLFPILSFNVLLQLCDVNPQLNGKLHCIVINGYSICVVRYRVIDATGSNLLLVKKEGIS